MTMSSPTGDHPDQEELEVPDMKKLAIRGALLGLLLGLVVVTSGAVQRRTGGNSVYKSLGTFSEVLGLVRNNYVEPADTKKLFDGAFAGITGALDPSCDYVSPEKLQAFKTFIDRTPGGVGIVLTRRGGYPAAAAVVPGSPAADAGFKGGEFIAVIGGKPTRGLALWETESLLVGAAGTSVELSILRPGKTRRENVKLVRKPFVYPSPKVDQRGEVAIFHPVRISKETAGALDGLLAKRPGTLIVDLRGSGGDDLDAAAAIGARFAGAGVSFAEEQLRQGEPKKWITPASSSRYSGPLAVLTDGGTAGTAEVLAGFLAEKVKAKTVGEPTSGLAGRRRLVLLPSGGGLYLTVVRYRPGGAAKAIDGSGIEPVEEVYSRDTSEKDGKDPILDRALELLESSALKKAA